jgi:hypothetical protein
VIGRVEPCVSEPVSDHGHVDPGGDELNADAVTPGVWCDALCRERRHVPAGSLNVLLQLEANTGGAERLSISVHEDWFVIGARFLLQQRLECWR